MFPLNIAVFWYKREFDGIFGQRVVQRLFGLARNTIFAVVTPVFVGGTVMALQPVQRVPADAGTGHQPVPLRLGHLGHGPAPKKVVARTDVHVLRGRPLHQSGRLVQFLPDNFFQPTLQLTGRYGFDAGLRFGQRLRLLRHRRVGVDALRRVRFVSEHVPGDGFVQKSTVYRQVGETLFGIGDVVAHVYYVYHNGSIRLTTSANGWQAYKRRVIATKNSTCVRPQLHPKIHRL